MLHMVYRLEVPFCIKDNGNLWLYGGACVKKEK